MHGAFEIISSLEDSNNAVARARWNVLLSVMAILAVIADICVYLLRSNVIKPLGEINGFIDKISDGDLSGTLEAKTRDEIGNMMTRLSGMTGRLNSMIKDISNVGDTLSVHPPI